MDDLDTVVDEQKHRWPLEGALKLPDLPAPRRHWVDVQVRDDRGSTLGFGFVQVPAAAEPALGPVALSPVIQAESVVIPRVDLPRGGTLAAAVQVAPLDDAAETVWEVSDAFGRLVARAMKPVAADGGQVRVDLKLPRPVTVCHQLDLTVRRADRVLARTRQHFTVTMPYPYDDFTALMWSYAGGDPVLRVTDRKCYEWGADMMDLCHVGGFADDKAAREFWLSARSGLRLVPYVTRLAGTANGSGAVPRDPCLHDPAYLDPTRSALVASCKQAEPFCPAAYTLGDENYLYEGSGEPCNTPYTMAAFRQWLQRKYGSIAGLNDAWATDLRDFADITQPMVLTEALRQTESFAPWLDHRLFMETAFAATHELFMDTIRTVDADAKVGWDGFLGWSPRSGYDFRQLTANLQLNQTYTTEWLQGEMVRSFKRLDALTGKWGNSVADVEAGWHAFPWDCLLSGDNSVWWWTSWGCDYIPFNPDTSQSSFGKWFFEAVRETTSGPGKLLLQAERVDSGVAVLHAQRNLFAGQLLAKLDGEASRAGTGDTGYLSELTALLSGLRDHGLQYRVIAPDQLSGPDSVLDRCKVLFAPLAVCLSDTEAAAIREFVRSGGTLVVDGRCGLLDGDGRIRQQRALDDVLGLQGPTGLQCMAAPSPAVTGRVSAALEGVAGTAELAIEKLEGRVLEAGVAATTAKSLVGDQPLLLVNRFGRGVALTLNVDTSAGTRDAAPLAALARERVETGLQPCEAILAAILRSAGVQPFCGLETPSGERPLCVQQVFYRDGRNAYLALMRDILVRGLPAEEFQVTLAEPAYVYDLRAGKLLGPGRQSSWSVRLDRGYPAVYALLPYRVADLEAFAPGQARLGDTVGLRARVVPQDATAGTHVFRLDVYSPGAETPHRQYSQNILAERGQGRAEIPFALNDPRGTWRLVFRDVATGTVTTRVLELQ
ncbi:MAG: hypothetical protein HPY69_07850 [Armatimonadetes bacterium]|nr:hypothetical protein [Armatimonadota bacterium]